MATPKKRGPKGGTSTSNFGVGKRESHDASAFYERFEAPTLSGDDDGPAPYEIDEPFVEGDARHMDAVLDNSVALVVTSPPYFAGKQYEEELEREGVPARTSSTSTCCADVFAECARKLEPGGRIAVNVANLGPQAVPQPLGRRDPHPAGRPEAAAARRGHLAQGRRRGRQLRVGIVPQGREPRGARHHRARGHREQGPLRPAPRAGPNASAAGCRRRTRSTPTSSWPRRSTSGTSRPRARAASRIPAPFPGRAARAADPTSTPTRAISCSTRSWVRARRWSPRRAATAATSATTSTPRTSTSRGCASATKATPPRRTAVEHDDARARTRRRQRRLPGARVARGQGRAGARRGAAEGDRLHDRRQEPARARHRRRRSTSSRPTPTTSSGTSTCRARSRARAAGCCAPTRCGSRSGARTCSRTNVQGSDRVPHLAPARARAARATSRCARPTTSCST